MVLGAIIGDIVGSIYEFNNHRSKEFELFTDECYFTDDTIMTLAIAKALKESKKNKFANTRDLVVKYMQDLGRPYPNCGWGLNFGRWIYSADPQPYNSYGNGAAMRVSACGWYGETSKQALELAVAVTDISHNHEEGIKGASAVAQAVYMARRGYSKREIQEKMQEYYDLDFTLDEIRDEYQFNETCQETVPQAIVAFLEAYDFEDAIRNAISIGGDSDTLAAITGSIAEAFYGIPEEIKQKALSYLDERLLAVYNELEEN